MNIEKTINFVKSCENKEGGFGSFPNDESSVDSTLVAIEIFKEIGLKIENKEKHIKFLKNCQNEDGGFGRKINEISTIDSTCSAVAALYEIGAYPNKIKEMINFINSCKNFDGGYGKVPNSQSNIVSTVSAISTLRIIDENFNSSETINYLRNLYFESENYGYYKYDYNGKGNIDYTHLALLGYEMCNAKEYNERIEKIINFVLDCQNEDGGFGGFPKYPSNIDYTYSALEILNKFNKFNVRLKFNPMKFIERCYNSDGGFGFIPNVSSKIEYTYYGICCEKYLKNYLYLEWI